MSIGSRKREFIAAELIEQYTVVPYSVNVEIKSIAHKGLKIFVERNDPRGLPPDKVNRVRNIVAALITASDIKEVIGPPGWRIHQLRGDRAHEWSISVSGNWRITFKIVDDKIFDLNLEDYH